MADNQLLDEIRTRIRQGVTEAFDILLTDGRRVPVRKGGDVSISPDGKRAATYVITGVLEVFETSLIDRIELAATGRRARRKAG